MKSEIQIKNSAGVCRIEIEGTIGVPEEWQFDQPEARVATYEKFRDDHRTGRIARLPRNLGQRPLPDPHGHLCRRRQRRRDSGKTRPAPPDRHAHRRGLCRPFRSPGRGVRGADGRKQRQRPLAVAREELPADRNVLLTAGERQELLRRSATAIRQAQQNASPTCTKPREDPSYGDTVRTANQRAYAEDVKRFKGI